MVDMTTKASLDKAGRIVLPKPVREKLRLQPGDDLAVETADDSITLRPIRPQSSIRKKRGIWVYHGQPSSDSIVDLIDQVREERIRELAG
jgi:AbrB family looped-hinge helix DNA binding protein